MFYIRLVSTVIGYIICIQSSLASDIEPIVEKKQNKDIRWEIQSGNTKLAIRIFDNEGAILSEYQLQECTSEGFIARNIFIVPRPDSYNLIIDCRSVDQQTLILLSTTNSKPINIYSSKKPIEYRVEPGAISFQSEQKLNRLPEAPPLPLELLQHVEVKPNTEMRFGPNTEAPIVAVINNSLQLTATQEIILPDGWVLAQSKTGQLGYVLKSNIVRKGASVRRQLG